MATFTTSTKPSIISSASSTSQAFTWATRHRRKKQPLTLQKLRKIAQALNATTNILLHDNNTTTTTATTNIHLNPHQISIHLARTALLSSYNDLLQSANNPSYSTTQLSTLQHRITAITPEINQLLNTNKLTPYHSQYLHFIETNLPIIEHTKLGIDALVAGLQHVAIPGLWLEFGVAKGTTLSTMAQAAATRSITVHGFDSFLGLPSDWRVGFETGKFSRQGVPPNLKETNIQYHVGWFNQTLPIFVQDLCKREEREEEITPISIIHIDCDVYESTYCILKQVQDRIVEGTIVVFDELINYNGYERHEMHAFFQLLINSNSPFNLRKRGLDVEWIGSKHEGCMNVALKIVERKVDIE